MERKKATLKSLDKEFNLYRPHFQDVAKYLTPVSYTHLTLPTICSV